MYWDILVLISLRYYTLVHSFSFDWLLLQNIIGTIALTGTCKYVSLDLKCFSLLKNSSWYYSFYKFSIEVFRLDLFIGFSNTLQGGIGCSHDFLILDLSVVRMKHSVNVFLLKPITRNSLFYQKWFFLLLNYTHRCAFAVAWRVENSYKKKKLFYFISTQP